MINSSSEDSDEDEGNERCFRRDIINAVERNDFEQLNIMLNANKFSISTIINKRDTSYKNNTLLHIALQNRKRNLDLKNNTKIIKLLLEKGANYNIRNDRGESPYHIVNKRLKTTCNNTESIEKLFLPNKPSSVKQSSSVSEDKIINFENNHCESVAEDDDELLFRNPTYQASGLKYSLHGVIYQLQLLILFLHRATKVYPSFYLATEMDKAEKFDDVVLKYKTSENEKERTWRFLQAKHVLNVNSNRINQKHLFSLNEKLPFSLHKYFNSFCKIRQNNFFSNANLKDFIICTNAELDLNANMFFIREKCTDRDKILYFKTCIFKMYRLKGISINELIKNYTVKFNKIPEKRYLKEFLEKFRLITNFPNKTQLNRLITKELGHRYGLLNAELATNTFKNHILEWLMSYKDGKSEYLFIGDGKGFLKSIEKQIRTLMTAGLSLAYPEKLKNYNVNFQATSKDIQTFLCDDQIQILHLVSESPLLTSIKVSQSLEQQRYQQDSFIFVKVKQLLFKNIRDLICKSFSEHKSHNLLIIDFEMHHKKLGYSFTDLYSRLSEILQKYSFKKLITISYPENDQVKEINDITFGIQFIISKDKIGYIHLDRMSQHKILTKEIYFQGKRIPLNQLINSNSAHDILDGMVLSSFLKNKEIIVSTNELCSLDLNINASYIPRTFSRQKIFSDILNDKDFISSNIIFLTGTSVNKLNFEIDKENVFIFEEEQLYKSGIILPPNYTEIEVNIDIFKKLCNKHGDENIYWLDNEGDQLRWEGFNGNITEIENYIDKNQSPECISEERFLTLKENTKKVCILEGEAGLGKSTFLANLISCLRTTHPFFWIHRINLNEHTNIKDNGCGKTLNDIRFLEIVPQRAVNFMLDILIPKKSDKKETYFTRRLLNCALQNFNEMHQYPKVVMLFDGFDEISPTYKEKTLVLLKALQQSSILQLWITTRTHETFCLEQKLQSPAYTLNPFSHEQKIEYVKNYYQKSKQFPFNYDKPFDTLCKCLEAIKLNPLKQEITQRKIGQNEDTCLDPIKQRLMDALNTNFTDNPLHLKMLTELTFNNNIYVFNNINLFFLYTEFVNIKFNIYYDEKTLFNGLVAANEVRQRDLKILRQIHQELALSVLLPEYPFENKKINADELVRIGFLKKNQSYISFVHRSFAEYFISNYVDEKFENPIVQNILYKHILKKHNFLGVRKFLNKNDSFLLQLKTSNIGENNWTMSLLSDMIEERSENILKSLLIQAKIGGGDILKNTKLYLDNLNLRELTIILRQLSILVNVILTDTELFLLFFDDIMEQQEDIYKNFCRCNCCLHIWALLYSANINVNILDRLFEMEVTGDTYLNISNKDEVFSKFLFKKCHAGQSVLHLAAKKGHLNLIQDLFMWIKEKAEPNFNDNVTRDNALYLLTSNKILYNLIFMTDREEKTFLHLLKFNDTFDQFLVFLFNSFPCQTLKQLFLYTDSYGRLSLHYLVANDKNDAIKNILAAFEKHFEVETITKIVFKVDQNGQTALHYVHEFIKLSAFAVLLHFSKSYFTKETFIKLLLIEDCKNQTILHSAVGCSSALQDLLNFCGKNYDKEILKLLLFHVDWMERTILHAAAGWNSECALIILLDFVKSYFGKNDMRMLLFTGDGDGQNVFHFACRYKAKTVSVLLNYILCNFDLETVKTLIVRPDKDGHNALHFAIKHNCIDALLNCLHFLEAQSNNLILDEVLFTSNSHGSTILHLATDQNSFQNYKVLLNFFIEHCNAHSVLKNVLFKTDLRGRFPLDIAIYENQKISPHFKSIYIWCINELPNNADMNSDILLTKLEASLLLKHTEILFQDDKNQLNQLCNKINKCLESFNR